MLERSNVETASFPVTDVRIQRVVDREAHAQALVIRETQFRKSLRDPVFDDKNTHWTEYYRPP